MLLSRATCITGLLKVLPTAPISENLSRGFEAADWHIHVLKPLYHVANRSLDAQLRNQLEPLWLHTTVTDLHCFERTSASRAHPSITFCSHHVQRYPRLVSYFHETKILKVLLRSPPAGVLTRTLYSGYGRGGHFSRKLLTYFVNERKTPRRCKSFPRL